jgi:hypothetical protein
MAFYAVFTFQARPTRFAPRLSRRADDQTGNTHISAASTVWYEKGSLRVSLHGVHRLTAAYCIEKDQAKIF